MNRFVFALLALCATSLLAACIVGAYVGRYARDTGLRICEWFEGQI